MTEKFIDITPDKSLMIKMGFVGFSPEQALAEFIDNSIDAKYDEETGEEIIKGYITIKINFDKDKIRIEDNSSGIKNVQEAMRLASSFKKNRLGTFGLGLKTAAMTFGRKIIVKTKYIGNDFGEEVLLDPEEWEKNNSWKAKVSTFSENPSSHYTIIEIHKLIVDPKLYEWQQIRNDLAFRFSEFIENNELKIFVDDIEVKPEPLEFISEKELKERLKQFGIPLDKFPKSRKEFEIRVSGMLIKGWIDILAKFSQVGRFGFNLYRGKRLITPFNKCCGISNHARHSRLFGHLYLPYDFPVTFTKDGFEISRKIWMELSKKVKEIISDHLSFCTKLAQHRSVPQVKPQTINEVNEYLDNIKDAIKDSELVNRLLKDDEDKIKKRSSEEKAEGEDEVEIEKRDPKVHPSFKKPIPKGKFQRNPKDKRQKKKQFYITLPNKTKIKIEHIFDCIEEPPIRMYYKYFDENEKCLQITTNTNFESWGLTKDEAFYAAMNIISALADFIYYQSENPSCTIEDIREDLWRHVGKVAMRNL